MAAQTKNIDISLRGLLEAGAHFGHQSRRWHPLMRQYLYGERSGVHIFDLVKTKELLEAAGKFASQVTSQGGLIVFVGTKRQAKGIVKEAAIRCGMPYVTERWLGGLLTNFQQLQKSLHQLQDLKSQRSEGKLSHLTKKERLLIDRKIDRLEKFFGGVTQLKELPQALFIVDAHNEDTAVREANNRNIKIIGLVDSNTNPDPVDYVIPANDDAVKSIQMIVNYIAQSILEGQKKADKKPVDKKNES